jgi:hypothetical protein
MQADDSRVCVCCLLHCSFGDTVLPEVQATVKAPTHRNMYKGISLCYSIISISYLAVAITGYWAFGSAVNPFVVYSFTGPQWAKTLALLLAIVQIVGCYQVCSAGHKVLAQLVTCRPTTEVIQVLCGLTGSHSKHACMRKGRL